MASFNYSTMQMTAKIVYYGPGLGGKTTNLQYIYDHTTAHSRGEMVSLETQTDRTLFFDLLPLEVGTIAGFKTRIQLYTVPGQVFYNTTRKLVLKGVDGVVFVADSQRSMLDANLESFRNLEANLAELGILIDSIPLYLQYNKRDLKDIFSIDELEQLLNRKGWASGEASAINGMGVFETLREISKQALVSLKNQLETARDRGGRPPWAKLPTAKPPAAEPPSVEPSLAPPPPGNAAPEAEPATTAPRPPEAAGNGRLELSRALRLILDRADLSRARDVALDLQVRDADEKVLRQFRNIRLPLEPGPELERVLLRLKIALDSGE